MGVNTSNNEGSKQVSKKKKLKNAESYELASDPGLPTDLDRAAGPVQPREDTWEDEAKPKDDDGASLTSAEKRRL